MTNIKPISKLRDYTSVLGEVRKNDPVYLEKNGQNVYVISTAEDYKEYERLETAFRLRNELEETITYNKEHGYVSEEMKRRFRR